MDIERIIHGDIPDVAQVYGGVRGRAMTEKHMWKMQSVSRKRWFP